jgi:threonine/homoserine/homoserine lactone efflux protein
VTLSASDLALYVAALFFLFLTPGPVWVALVARGASGGFAGVWPLALGVAFGDALWPLAAIYGLGWVAEAHAGVLDTLRWVAVAIFVAMGVGLIMKPDAALGADSRLTRPGVAAGFAAGVAVILGNPKAILFYLGVLPGFFDMGVLTAPDIAVIVLASMAVPLVGNLALGAAMGQARRLLASPGALRRTNRIAGVLLIAVGGAIALS